LGLNVVYNLVNQKLLGVTLRLQLQSVDMSLDVSKLTDIQLDDVISKLIKHAEDEQLN
jgi:hypothetical protein